MDGSLLKNIGCKIYIFIEAETAPKQYPVYTEEHMKQTLQNINGRMNHMNSVMKQSKDKLKDKLASASMALSGTAGEPDTIDLANNSNF